MYTGLKTGIKVNNIEHLTDARYFAAAGVNYMGFDLRNLSKEDLDAELQKVVKIKEWVTGPRLFVTLIEVTEDILEKLFEIGIDAIEVEKSSELVGIEGFHWFLPLSAVQNDSDLASFDNVDFVATLKEWENSKFANAWVNGVDLGSIDLILAKNALGIQIEGSPQEKVGFKAYDEYDDLFETLED